MIWGIYVWVSEDLEDSRRMYFRVQVYGFVMRRIMSSFLYFRYFEEQKNFQEIGCFFKGDYFKMIVSFFIFNCKFLKFFIFSRNGNF